MYIKICVDLQFIPIITQVDEVLLSFDMDIIVEIILKTLCLDINATVANIYDYKIFTGQPFCFLGFYGRPIIF